MNSRSDADTPKVRAPTVREDRLLASDVEPLVREMANLDTLAAARRVAAMEPGLASRVLRAVSPETADRVLCRVADEQRGEILRNIPDHVREQWERNRGFPAGSVGRLMDAPVGLLDAGLTVAQAVERLRGVVTKEFVTYGYVVDADRTLKGVLVMRDLLFARGDEPVEDIMVRDPFFLHPATSLMDAMRQVVLKHYPVYPVCDDAGRIVGLVRGYRLFEAQAFEIGAQAGRMVGVEKEEQTATPWYRSFRFRHPWLQMNLLTAFAAGAVVNFFQSTIDQVVLLAVFLPVLAGQCGSTGSQALAVTLRGMTLGQVRAKGARGIVLKEALLGLLNGSLVGLSATLAMFFLATHQGNPRAIVLSLAVFLAMTVSCILGGVSGVLVPLGMKRLGADPATASAIILSTTTDVVSMGLLLALATWLVL